MEASHEQPTRRRPLGLTIALLATAIGYGIIPLLPLLLILWSRLTRRSVTAELLGGDLFGITTVLGVLSLIVCLLAWIGRPARIRWVLIGLIWVQSGLLLFRIVQSLTATPDLIGSVGGSLSGFSGLLCQLPTLLFVPLYVTWYLNRAPARAFYRRQP